MAIIAVIQVLRAGVHKKDVNSLAEYLIDKSNEDFTIRLVKDR